MNEKKLLEMAKTDLRLTKRAFSKILELAVEHDGEPNFGGATDEADFFVTSNGCQVLARISKEYAGEAMPHRWVFLCIFETHLKELMGRHKELCYGHGPDWTNYLSSFRTYPGTNAFRRFWEQNHYGPLSIVDASFVKRVVDGFIAEIQNAIASFEKN